MLAFVWNLSRDFYYTTEEREKMNNKRKINFKYWLNKVKKDQICSALLS